MFRKRHDSQQIQGILGAFVIFDTRADRKEGERD